MPIGPFKWCESTPLAILVQQSSWLFPCIESLHLCGFALLAGSALIVDFQLLGFGLKEQSLEETEKAIFPWLVSSLSVVIFSGILLFFSEATKLYGNRAFWVKMAALLIAILSTLLVRTPLIRRRKLQNGKGKIFALVSILLWFFVALCGRWIGLS